MSSCLNRKPNKVSKAESRESWSKNGVLLSVHGACSTGLLNSVSGRGYEPSNVDEVEEMHKEEIKEMSEI